MLIGMSPFAGRVRPLFDDMRVTFRLIARPARLMMRMIRVRIAAEA